MINYLEEFDRQWDMLESAMYVELKNLCRESVFPLERANEVYQDEQNRWRTLSQGNYSWMQMLHRTNPEVASAFESKLYTLTLESVDDIPQVSQIPTVVTGCCGAVAGYVAANFLSPWGLPANLAVGLATGALSSWCINSKTVEKAKLAREELIDQYMQQLTAHGKLLKEILSSLA